MKHPVLYRIYSLILVLLLCFSLSACQTADSQPQSPTQVPSSYPILFLDGIEGDTHAYVLCAIDSGELKTADDYLYNGKPLSDYLDCQNEAVSSDILDTAQEFTFINANGMTFQTGIDGLTCTDRPIDESFAVCAKVDGQPGEKNYYLGSYTGVSLLPADMTVGEKQITADLDGDGRLDTVSWAFTPANPEDYGEHFNYTITVAMGGTSYSIESDEYYPCKEEDLTIFVADLDQNGKFELVVCKNSLSRFRSVTVYQLNAGTAETWLTYVIDPEP